MTKTKKQTVDKEAESSSKNALEHKEPENSKSAISGKSASASKGTPNFTELSGSFAAFLRAACDKSLTSTILAYTQALAEVTSKSQQEMIDVWNKLVPDFMIKLESQGKTQTATTIPGKICAYYFPKAKKACTCEVSVRSKSGQWCSKHLAQEDKKVDDSKESKSDSPKVECEYVPSKGNNPGVKCTNVVCAKSNRFCSRHVKSGEKAEKTESKKKEAKEDTGMHIEPRFNRELNVYVDAKMNFVLHRTKKDIYAKLVDGKIVALSAEDMELLDKHEYKYNKDLFGAESEEKEEVNSPGEEEDDSDEEKSDDE
jgi:hypothetical protein